METESKLSPCPFCGQDVQILRTDSEGNLQPDKYFDEEGARSGISYSITHTPKDDKVCPIATHEDEPMGCWQYDSIEELAGYWNKRKN